MLTFPATYDSLPETVKSAMLALSILIDRIESLPKADRDHLFDLLQEWRTAEKPDERDSVRRAMEEVLAQVPITTKSLSLDSEPLARGLKKWAEHVGGEIRRHRDQAGLTQVQLAERAGLPQSHISRLENAEHSATNLTLEKIAKALNILVEDLDPCTHES